MELTNKSELLDYLKQHTLWAKKGLSQNFLIDKVALDDIVAAAELKPDDLVVEIGPGLGTMTQELVRHAGEVLAIEMDEKLASLLPQKIESRNLKVINSDILRVNLNEIIDSKEYKVVANIPYHITSKILELFLSRENKPELIVLLVQKEVAERICAKPGDMSVLAVSVQLFGRPEVVNIVRKESFFPSPKVDSAILRIVISNQLSVVSKEQERDFFRCVHVGFAAKRKTLVNNLMVGYQLERIQVLDILKSMGLKETVRAQELSVQEWKELTETISQLTVFNSHQSTED